MFRNRTLLIVLVVMVSVALVAPMAFAKKRKKHRKKGEAPPPPPVGVVEIGDWQCWNPPKWDDMREGDKLMKRQEGYQHVWALITGEQRKDFVVESDSGKDFFERAFLGRPELLYDWLGENFKRCKAVAEGKASAADYNAYLSGIGAKLEANECYAPLIYEVHDFLDIQTSWQLRFHICKDDAVMVEATSEENGKFTVNDTGKLRENKYITATGDPDVPEAGDKGYVSDMPLGALLLRFEAEDGSYTRYFPMGFNYEFKAPDHGFISFAVNDNTLYDNAFYKLGGAIDYMGISIYPALKEGQ